MRHLQIESQTSKILENYLVDLPHMVRIKTSQLRNIMNDIREDWHKCMICLPLITMLIDNIFKLCVIKHVKRLDRPVN